ncbi:MAG: fibronectin type III domain-containing protein [Deltaproteobacteria bacterium]|nr:fibronectin type III domain-containing protein [Deltaproteobacteria bacterium]
MNRRRLGRRLAGFATLLALAAACGDSTSGDDASDLPPLDIVCTDGSPTLELRCPTELDLGCVAAEGVPAHYGVVAAACDGAPPTVACTPPDGSTFAPGDAFVSCTATATSGETESCTFPVHALPAGGFELLCADPVGASCAGAATPVDVPDPTVVERCGTLVGALASDAPAGGFAVGETVVTFLGSGAGGFAASCGTTVTVTDDAPPTLVCPPEATVVRAAADAEAAPPAATATDACAGELPAVPLPGTLPRGSWPVEYTATDPAGLTASCRTEVTVLDAFAVEGLRVARARLQADDTTSVTLVWEPSAGADATGYRVERAGDPAGPWTALETLGAAELLHTDPALPGTAAWYRVVTLAGALDGGASVPVRALAVTDAGYDLRGQRVPTISFDTTLYGVVRHPVDLGRGPYPLVLMLHGNHGNCRPSWGGDDQCSQTQDHECHWPTFTTTPNAEGLIYAAETLAAHGVVAVSVSGNAVNCRDDYIFERTELLLEHLRRWRTWVVTGGDPFGTTFVGRIDLARTGLVGHSRGGEAVSHGPARLAATPIPGVALGSVFAIAPTDYHEPWPTAAAYAVVAPGCDGDVPTSHPIAIYDRSLQPPGRPRSQVFFIGANHNYFNTEWRSDDNELERVCWERDQVGAEAQRGMLDPVLAAWFEGTLVPGGALEPFLRADGDTPRGIEALAGVDLDLRWSHAAEERLTIDDLSGAGAPAVNLLGEPNSQSGFSTSRACYENGCDASFDHPLDALLLSWDGGAGTATWGLGTLDATSRPTLSFRVVSRVSTLNDGLTEQEFAVRLVDADGTVVEFPVSTVRRVPHLYTAVQRYEVLQTVRVPLGPLAAWTPGFDAAGLARFELQTGLAGHTRGSLLVTDLELSSY